MLTILRYSLTLILGLAIGSLTQLRNDRELIQADLDQHFTALVSIDSGTYRINWRDNQMEWTRIDGQLVFQVKCDTVINYLKQ
jgi:hypothetical protein